MNEETKHILEKVGLLYQRFGIRSVTMDDVAGELGISKKTLYQHFADKEELVTKVTDYMINIRHNCLNEIHNKGLNAIDELFEVAEHVSQMLKDHNPATEYDLKKYYPEEYQKIRIIKREMMHESVLNNLRKGMEEGIYRKEMKPEVIAKLHVARVEGMMESDLFSTEDYHNREQFREIMIYHIRGIANEKGIKILEEKLKADQL
jgi:TetR/AcrR family transcriptional regulator, cholesterol catabolism regulator